MSYDISNQFINAIIDTFTSDSIANLIQSTVVCLQIKCDE